MTQNKCVSPEDWDWLDCDIKGHEEGCFMTRCPACGTTDRDCEVVGW